MSKRSFLMLQGPVGPFFALLGERLRRSGQDVHRIHLNGGDLLYGDGARGVDFRGFPETWPQFLAEKLENWRVTDVLLFGDCRPPHRVAAELARRTGIEVHVFEEGYLRPNWVTMERGGVNGHSTLPRDPAAVYEAARGLPPWQPGDPVPSSFMYRAATDVAYNLATAVSAWRFPGYRSHRPWSPFIEYRQGARRFPRYRRMLQDAKVAVDELMADPTPYFLFPLQLPSDSQIRHHSPYGCMTPAIQQVVESFGRFAPSDARLIVTEHPLDTGVINLAEVTQQSAEQHLTSGRVHFLHGGSPTALVERARGLVTVNSTIGLMALGSAVPVKALGHSIYDIDGLTSPGSLDGFWSAPQGPNPGLFDCLRRVICARTQLNGGFHSPAALAMAVAAAAQRLCPNPVHFADGARARTGASPQFGASLETVT